MIRDSYSIVIFRPDTAGSFDGHGKGNSEGMFSKVVDEACLYSKRNSPHPPDASATESVEIGILIEGEFTLIVDRRKPF